MTTSLPRRAIWISCAIVTAITLMATAAVASPRLRSAGGDDRAATVSASSRHDRAIRSFHRFDRRRPRPPVTVTVTTVVPSTVTPSTADTAATGSTPTAGTPTSVVPAPVPPTAEITTTTIRVTTTTTQPTRATTTSTRAATTASTTAPPVGGGNAPTHFNTLPPGASLPSSAQCAAWVDAVPAPPEVKGINAVPNATRGQAVAGATGRSTRVDGNYTGTTEQILRWAACKWGIDEDMVKAQAVIESWWRMDTKGDRGTDPTRCAPGHGIGVDGFPGECPESWGLLQVRYPYNQVAFPYAITSSAFNADWAYAQWRSCFEGDLTWLNTVERGSDYAAGDAWGCFGTWFSGRWYTQGAKDYIARVQGTLAERTWTTANFKQP
ncbi:MAG: hypothetical protein R2761_19590 [Acidimicrobiales bacterium]